MRKDIVVSDSRRKLNLRDKEYYPEDFGRCWQCRSDFQPDYRVQVYCEPCRYEFSKDTYAYSKVYTKSTGWFTNENGRNSDASRKGWVTRKQREQVV